MGYFLWKSSITSKKGHLMISQKPKLKILIGHRGVGKTSLLHRLRNYFPTHHLDDLDHIIIQAHGSIENIFDQFGEEHFRNLEIQYFSHFFEKINFASEQTHWISVGAGAQLERIHRLLKLKLHEADYEFIWISRSTDSDGRIFLNRPLLNKSLRPTEDFLERKKERDSMYSQFAHWVYHLPEGFDQDSEIEKALFESTYHQIHGVVTILPEHFESISRWNCFLRRFLKNPEIIFELRNDYFQIDQMSKILSAVSADRILLSIRKNENLESLKLEKFWKIDWAMELGTPSVELDKISQEKLIYSFHENSVITEQHSLIHSPNCKVHLKVSPIIHSWEELEKWIQWQRTDPEFRSLHPRSRDGQWKWMRLINWNQQKLNFIKDFNGSALDQPSLLEVLQLPVKFQNFAAVIGSPVEHSRSPQEQNYFFHSLGRPFVSIKIDKNDFQKAISFLKEIGMDHVAVTSPLKELAFEVAILKTDEAQNLKSVNTLFWNSNEKQWQGHNTDLSGFDFQMHHLLQQLPIHPQIVVWGGGGTLAVIQKVLPHVILYSSTQGLPRDSKAPDKILNPSCVIWAAPNSDKNLWPPQEWQPQMVVDLNYKENSFGIEYAMKARCHYSSGLSMFKIQAEEQRKYWSRYHVSK